MANVDRLDRDYGEHEHTFTLFVAYVRVAALHILAMIVVVALWGFMQSDGWAVLGFALVLAATAIAFVRPNTGWRWLGGTLLLLLLILAL
jgi:hypothetical protein